MSSEFGEKKKNIAVSKNYDQTDQINQTDEIDQQRAKNGKKT
jgi:hypothetical protein